MAPPSIWSSLQRCQHLCTHRYWVCISCCSPSSRQSLDICKVEKGWLLLKDYNLRTLAVNCHFNRVEKGKNPVTCQVQRGDVRLIPQSQAAARFTWRKRAADQTRPCQAGLYRRTGRHVKRLCEAASVNMVVVIITILSETPCSGVRASLPILRKQKLTECSEPPSERHTAHTEAGVGTQSISHREWC